ncbi:na[+]/H[+] hydrogen exchanger 2 isoform 4-T4 [Glossina fuscipes fuscipes]
MFAGHLKNYNNSNEFFGQQSNEFLKATSIKRKQEQKLEENSFIISPDVNNRSLVLGNMRIAKGNDTESRASPSLAQEMNLARRACWCNNRSLLPVSINEMDEQKCCENKCFKNNYEDNVVTNAIAKTTTTTKTKTTKILNGAENFSKILFNKHTNDNVVSNDKKDDGNERAIENVSILVNNYNYNYNNNGNYYDGDDDDDDDETITNNLSEMENVNLVKRKRITTKNVKELCCSAVPKSTLTSSSPISTITTTTTITTAATATITTTTITNTAATTITAINAITSTSNVNKNLKQSSCSTRYFNDCDIVASMRVQFGKFWLAFVEYCDRNTIKPNDPRFFKQNNSNHPNQKQAEKFRLLTNKKVIFLFIVCLFFSCINRIEGRPESSDSIPGVTDATKAINLAQSLVPNAILSSANPGEEMSAMPQQYVVADPGSIHTGVEVLQSDEHKHAPERYPLSQVDFERVKTPFIIGVWILSASIAKIGFHMTPKLHLIFPESCLLIVVGVVIGVVLFFGTNVGVSPLTPNTFFFYMLPPIILDAGYFMPNRLFFDNLGTILLMAVVGTIFNIATIGGSLWACGQTGIFGSPEDAPKFLDIFLFASLISAVDPVAVLAVFEEIHVNEILYIVVFGESLLNDAVTVVMYHMMEVYNEMGLNNIIVQDVISGVGSFFVVALGGTVIGIIWGFLTGLVTRFTDHVRVIEPIFIFVMAYLAYLNAEIFHMSGIMAITFCGITMKNYVESNISQKSHTTVKYALKMLSSSSETIIFMFLGVATVDKGHDWNTWFVVLTIVFCSVYRVIGVIILSALANRFRLHKLSRVDQFVMSYGGLRGAVAFALVLLIDEGLVPQKNMFVTTTIAVIYFTVFVQGITIKPLVKILNVKRASKRKPTMNERIHERFMDHLMAGIEDIVGKTGNYNVRDKFKRFDNRFIRPLLIRDLKGAEPKIIETYSKLTMRDAIEVMRRNPSTIGQITGTESMSALFRNYTNNCIGGSPSLTNLDNTCSRNLDMHELDYNPSKKDLTDAKIHHLLAEELKPYRRHRRLSYSRHAVDDRDLSTQVNYKMQMHFRRMFNDRKHHKRSKRGVNKNPDGVKQNHVSFHDFQQNGTTKQFSHEYYINEVLHESAEENPTNKLTEVTVVGPNDDWDDGLTFTAKSSPDSDRANNNSLIAHIQNLPGFDTSKARIVQHYATATNTNANTNNTVSFQVSPADESPEKLISPDPSIGPTAAELILPWRRDRSYQSIAENAIPEEDRQFSRDSDGEHRVATPTATESQLPWKRQGDEISDAVQQNEFPAWASNKEYLAYNSPSATFLGGINKPKQHKSVIGLFRRESSGSRGTTSIGGDNADGGSAPGSDPALAAILSNMVAPSSSMQSSRLDKRSASISAASNLGDGHAGPFPVTASHRRNTRRGSMLELSGDTIPEESYHHGHSKSLCEPHGDEWDSDLTETERKPPAVRPNSEKLLRAVTSGREPLLPKLTPRAQIKRGMSVGASMGLGSAGKNSKVTTALLATANSDDDDDEDEEDFDLYNDENIVVTTTHSNEGGSRPNSASDENGDSGGSTATTTTIRLTRKNDESII